jgi:hypothetical protein
LPCQPKDRSLVATLVSSTSQLHVIACHSFMS